MTPRDTSRDAASWARIGSAIAAKIANEKVNLAQAADASDRAFSAVQVLKLGFEHLLARYASGEPVALIAADARGLLGQDLPTVLASFPPRPDGSGAPPAGHDVLLRFAALLILSRPSADEAAAGAGALTHWDRGASPVETRGDLVLAAFLGALSPSDDRPKGDKLIWPEAYKALWTALDPATPQARRLPALQRFLRGWYARMEADGAAQSGREQKGNLRYVGHWCLEAAAAVVILGLDDASLRGHPHYPGDLVDFWRAGAAGK